MYIYMHQHWVSDIVCFAAVLLLGFSSGGVVIERTSPTADGSFTGVGAGMMSLVQILINMGSPSLEDSQVT